MTWVREVLRETLRLLRKHPWLLLGPLVPMWYGLRTKEERVEFLRRALEDDR